MPTFQHAAGQGSYTLVGRDPAQGGATTIPTVLVPVTLSFDAKKTAGKPFVMDAAPDVPRVLRSPVFSKFAFPSGGTTQYADAMLRTTFPKADGWHTLLGKPEVKPVKITVPARLRLHPHLEEDRRAPSPSSTSSFCKRRLFKQLPKQDGKLVIAMTHNTTYYADGDATVCCSWGTHGVDSATGNSFVLGSYLHAAPAVVEDGDVQPLTQQLAEFINDPLHDPLLHGRNVKTPGNIFPGWMRPGKPGRLRRHGRRLHLFSSRTHQHEPQEQYPRVEGLCRPWPTEPPITCRTWPCCPGTPALPKVSAHYSFPDAQALTEPAKPCPARGGRGGAARPHLSAHGRGGPAERPAERPSAHRLLGRLRRGGFHHPAARGLAAVGRHHRRLLDAG